MRLGDIYQTPSSRSQIIKPFTNRDSEIHIYQNRDLMSDRWNPATVNWPACGSQDVETIKEFAAGITKACEIAESWTSELC